MAKSANNYFQMMCEVADCSLAVATKLKSILADFSPDKLDADMKEIHAIEHHGDMLKHRMVQKLVKEFITPIEREDIMTLIDQLDDVIDTVEDVVLKLYMYNVKAIPDEAMRFAEIVCRCADEMVVMFSEFADFKKSKKILASIIELNRLEEEGDALYVAAVRGLYQDGADAMVAAAWTEVFTCLEKCCDMYEHVADLVETVIMKNT